MNLAQRSFAAGEVAPALYARTDLSKYQTGCRTLRNFLVQRHGGASNRPGTELVREVKDSSRGGRLIPWIFNDEQTYVLELGERYLRIHQDGGVLVVSGVVGWVTATLYAVGDLRSIGGVTYYATLAHTSGGTTEPGVGASWQTAWYALSGTVYEIPTPYDAADLPLITFAQSADVLTLAHPDYPPRELARSAHTRWTLAPVVLGPAIGQVTNLGATGGSVGALRYWAVTAVDEATNEEGLPTFFSAIDRIPSPATPVALSWSPVGGAVEYNVYYSEDGLTYGFKGAAGGTALTQSDTAWTTTSSSITTTLNVTVVTAADQARNPVVATIASKAYNGAYAVRGRITVSSSGVGADATQGIVRAYYSRDGEARVDAGIVSDNHFVYGDDSRTDAFAGSVTVPDNGYATLTIDLVAEVWQQIASGSPIASASIDTSAAPDNVITWSTTGNGFLDTGSAVNLQQAPPTQPSLFAADGDYPAAVGIYQQRRFFAASRNAPETVWGSRTGSYRNFAVSTPLQDDDMVSWRFGGKQMNAVRHLLDLGRLVAFTSGSEQLIKGDENAAGVIRPGEINPSKLSANGCSALVPPLEVGASAVFVQAQGSTVHDLTPVSTDSYEGNDLTVFSSHLVEGYTLVDATYAQKPNGVLWFVRDDGVLLSLTYLREHGVWGWARHDTDGLVEKVCAIPEGREWRLYLVVQRTINGATKRYVERMAVRTITPLTAQRDFIFTDSTLSYDGWHTGATTITLSGGVAWDSGETLTATASAGTYVAGDVGNALHLIGSDGSLVRAAIEGYTDATHVTVRADRVVPVGMRGVAVTTWARAVDEFTGLSHLEGKDVAVLADGFVVSSPNNADVQTLTVSGGSISLGRPYAVVRVGLPYISDFETLDLDTPSGQSRKGKKSSVKRVGLFLDKTRGVYTGRAFPTGDDPLENLDPYPSRESEDTDSPPDLVTDDIHVPIVSAPDTNARIVVRQVDPLPVTILAAITEGDLG